MRAKYFAAILGNIIRIAYGKYSHENNVKRYCFGVTDKKIIVKDLGTRKDNAFKKLIQIREEINKFEKGE